MTDRQDDTRPQRPGTTTAIPALGITFAEAFARWLELRRQESATAAPGTEEADDAAAAINDQHGAIMAAVMKAPPQTPADAAVILHMVADNELGIGVELGHDAPMVEALTRAAALIGPVLDANDADAELLEAFARWRQIAERPKHDDDDDDDEADAAAEERALFWTITASPAHTLAGAVIKLAWMADFVGFFSLNDPDFPELGNACRTLNEAAERQGGPIGQAIRRAVQSIQLLERNRCAETQKVAEIEKHAPRDDDERAVIDAMRGIDKRTRSDFVMAITAYRQMHSAAIATEMFELFAGRMHAEAKRMPAAMASARAAIANMRGLMSRQPDQPQDADPFGAAVAEFEQAAPSILPAVPSAVMVEAGAAAAGIDATTVRALYAAMARAHQRSAAA